MHDIFGEQSPTFNFQIGRHVSERERLGLTEPSPTWVFGWRLNGTGIEHIGYEDSFLDIGDGAIRKYLTDAGKLVYFAYHMKPGDAGYSEKTIQEARGKIRPAERAILEITGFTLRGILDWKSELLKKYRGKTEASFRVELG